MIYVTVGGNGIARQKERRKIIAENGGDDRFSIASIDGTAISAEALREALAANDLFGRLQCISVNKGIDREDIESAIRDALGYFKDSENILIVETKKIAKPVLNVFQKFGARIIELKEESKEKPLTLFPLTDACLIRDRKNAWVKFIEAKERGVSAEEIHAMLWWQYKMLVLVSLTSRDDMKNLTQSPFVVNKTKSALVKYKDKEPAHILSSLIGVLSRSRERGKDLMNEVEMFILEKV